MLLSLAMPVQIGVSKAWTLFEFIIMNVHVFYTELLLMSMFYTLFYFLPFNQGKELEDQR